MAQDGTSSPEHPPTPVVMDHAKGPLHPHPGLPHLPHLVVCGGSVRPLYRRNIAAAAAPPVTGNGTAAPSLNCVAGTT